MIEAEKTYWSAPTVQLNRNGRDLTGHSDLSIEIIHDDKEMQLLEEDWDLLASNSSATIYQTFDWQYYWWKHFGSRPDQHLMIVLFKIWGRLIGVAPMFIQSYNALHYRVFRRLMLLGSGLKNLKSPAHIIQEQEPANCLDVIAERGYEEDISRVFAVFLKQESYLWDEVYLQNIREDGFLFKHMLPVLADQNFSIQKRVSNVFPKIVLRDSKKTEDPPSLNLIRYQIQPSESKYFGNSEYTIEDFSDSDNVAGVVQSLSNLHEKKWNAEGYPSLFTDSYFRSFQQELLLAMAKKNRLWVKKFNYQGDTVKIHLGFRFNGSSYLYISDHVFDGESIQTSISDEDSFVLSAVIDDAVKTNCRELDLGSYYSLAMSRLNQNVIRGWEIKLHLPLVNRKLSRAWNFRMIRLHDFYSYYDSRLKYEISMMKVIIREKGFMSMIPIYLHHLIKRIEKRWKKLEQLSKYGIKRADFAFCQHRLKESWVVRDRVTLKYMQTDTMSSVIGNNHLYESQTEEQAVEFISTQDDLRELHNDWVDIEENIVNPLVTIDWFQSAAQTFCPPNILKMVAVKNDRKLTAIAPISLKGGLLPRFELVGSSTIREPGGLIFRNNNSLNVLVDKLFDLKKPLFFRGFRLFSPEVESMEYQLMKRPAISLVSEEKIPFVDIDGSWEDFEMNYISSSRRSSFRRLKRKLEKAGKVSYNVVTPTPENLDEYLEEVFRIEASNWKGKDGTAIKTHPSFRKFYRIYSKKTAERGELRLFFMRVGDENIAAQLTVVHGNRLWIYKIGYDEQWSWCSPGVLLMNYVVEYCFENKLNACEFLGTDEPWLHIWANGFHSLVTYEIYPRSLRGILTLLLNHLKPVYHKVKVAMYKIGVVSNSQ